jgi:hypothetical protein
MHCMYVQSTTSYAYNLKLELFGDMTRKLLWLTIVYKVANISDS